MKAIPKGIGCACIMFLLAGISHAQEWRGIVPLHSTHADVERILGKSSDKKSPVFYDLKDVTVLIAFTNGLPCKAEGADGWKVPQDMVLTIAVNFMPGFTPKLSEFRYDLRKFEKTNDPHVPGIIHYQSDEEGISFSVEGEFISNIAYYPAKKNWHLMCNPRLTTH